MNLTEFPSRDRDVVPRVRKAELLNASIKTNEYISVQYRCVRIRWKKRRHRTDFFHSLVFIYFIRSFLYFFRLFVRADGRPL